MPLGQSQHPADGRRPPAPVLCQATTAWTPDIAVAVAVAVASATPRPPGGAVLLLVLTAKDGLPRRLSLRALHRHPNSPDGGEGHAVHFED